jgi:hypothetical protein
LGEEDTAEEAAVAVADGVEVLRAVVVEHEAHFWELWEGRMGAVVVATGQVGPQQPGL